MKVKEYGCNSCRLIFESPESKTLDAESNVKCPYCEGSDVQILGNPGDMYDFVRRISRIRYG